MGCLQGLRAARTPASTFLPFPDQKNILRDYCLPVLHSHPSIHLCRWGDSESPFLHFLSHELLSAVHLSKSHPRVASTFEYQDSKSDLQISRSKGFSPLIHSVKQPRELFRPSGVHMNRPNGSEDFRGRKPQLTGLDHGQAQTSKARDVPPDVYLKTLMSRSLSIMMVTQFVQVNHRFWWPK